MGDSIVHFGVNRHVVERMRSPGAGFIYYSHACWLFATLISYDC